jgi:hypothetical protein
MTGTAMAGRDPTLFTGFLDSVVKNPGANWQIPKDCVSLLVRLNHHFAAISGEPVKNSRLGQVKLLRHKHLSDKTVW